MDSRAGRGFVITGWDVHLMGCTFDPMIQALRGSGQILQRFISSRIFSATEWCMHSAVQHTYGLCSLEQVHRPQTLEPRPWHAYNCRKHSGAVAKDADNFIFVFSFFKPSQLIREPFLQWCCIRENSFKFCANGFQKSH